ncbi:dihydroneopterin aldolase [Paraflavisolibacter sp. H34]|uniref:dihydroneopterin aldolase n=1 Tax=Huijunlia imazamoxiresistens TaxID=3127457 RepID=UPI003016D91E
MAGSITIELKGLRFFAEHGMYAEERKVGNQFEIDLSATYKAPKHPIVSIEETVNYVEIYRIIEEEFSGHKHLLETCAMQICDRLHEQFPELRTICISIKKMSPPITNFTGSVGVTYTREFSGKTK